MSDLLLSPIAYQPSLAAQGLENKLELRQAYKALQHAAATSLFSPSAGHFPHFLRSRPQGPSFSPCFASSSFSPRGLSTCCSQCLELSSSFFSLIFSYTNSDLSSKVICFGKLSLTALMRSNLPVTGSVNSTYLSTASQRENHSFMPASAVVLKNVVSPPSAAASPGNLLEVPVLLPPLPPRPTEPKTPGWGPAIMFS